MIMRWLLRTVVGCWVSGARHVSSAICWGWQSSLTMAASPPSTPKSSTFSSTSFPSSSCLTDCLGCRSHLTHLACIETRMCNRLSTLLTVVVCGAVLFWIFQEQLVLLLPWLVSTDPYIGFIVFFILFVIISLPFSIPGYLVLNVAAGYRYGIALGTMTVIFCALGGAYCAFVFCRLPCTAFLLAKLQNDYLQAIVNLVEGEHSFKVIALTRLTPIPFGLQNGLFAMTNVSVCTFVSATAVGLFPNQLLSSYLGSTLRSVKDLTHHQWNSPVVIIQVCLTITLSCYVIAKAQRHLLIKIHDHKVNKLEENTTIQVIPTALPRVNPGSKVKGQGYGKVSSVVNWEDKLSVMIETEMVKGKELTNENDNNQNAFEKWVT
ncbi:transmembrane protein 64-like [Asterias rubens]|uniref:transmembrane protein 64-like n=1 Tax=Asterias rubens TaxID=7604 RepID=UPI0014559D48|nr:transmembrane protein 64-like [Asterias rubens]